MGEGNLYNFYGIVFNKISESLKKPFALIDGETRKESTDFQIALREAFINCLIHADYRVNIKLIIEKKETKYSFRNSGSLRINEKDFYTNSSSNPRNLHLAFMFRMVNFAEEAGSGIPRIIKQLKIIIYNYLS